MKSEELWFWGKIVGLENDYYILKRVDYAGHYQFPSTQFFWALSTDFVFRELPGLNSDHLADVNEVNTFFKGDPNVILKKYEEEEQDPVDIKDDQIQADLEKRRLEDDYDSDEELVKEVKKVLNFTELSRLSFIVRNIDFDTSAVPQGAFNLTPEHELRRAKIFRGLTKERAGRLENYMHFRDVVSQEKREYIEEDDAIFKEDLLDPLLSDSLKGSWTIQVDASGSIANLRSLLWPGYFAFHKANTHFFGGVYVGEGIKEVNIAFAL